MEDPKQTLSPERMAQQIGILHMQLLSINEQNRTLQQQNSSLSKQLQETLSKLSEYERADNEQPVAEEASLTA